jgi:hypothetical protein
MVTERAMLHEFKRIEFDVGRVAGLLTARFGCDRAAAYAYRQAEGCRSDGEPLEALRWKRIAWTIRAKARIGDAGLPVWQVGGSSEPLQIGA